jgi:hypothetical protein
LIGGVLGCGGADEEREQTLLDTGSVQLIAAPEGVTFHDPAWFTTTNEIMFTLAPPGDSPRDQISAVHIDGTGVRRLPLPADRRPACNTTTQTSPTPLSDGRLAYVAVCWGDVAAGTATRLLAFDPKAHRVERLVRYSLPFSIRPHGLVTRRREREDSSLPSQASPEMQARASPASTPRGSSSSSVPVPRGYMASPTGSRQSEESVLHGLLTRNGSPPSTRQNARIAVSCG